MFANMLATDTISDFLADFIAQIHRRTGAGVTTTRERASSRARARQCQNKDMSSCGQAGPKAAGTGTVSATGDL